MATTQAPPIAPPKKALAGKALALRVVVIAGALTFWFWTQALIGSRPLPASGIGDWSLAVTASANQYLLTHAAAANALLIISSALIDLMAIFLLGRYLFQGEPRPLLGLVIVLGLRQIMQACVALPAPPNQIWHYPGFPSLLVTYGVSNDYFFSGHTSIAVLAATELARFRGRIWTVLAASLAVFEIATVLVLHAHYSMDVFTGLIAGLYASHLAHRISAHLKRTDSPHPQL